MTNYLSKTIDDLVERIDALIVYRAQRANYGVSVDAISERRTAIADCLTDFVAALKDELTETFATR